jgi:hypothetical protein
VLVLYRRARTAGDRKVEAVVSAYKNGSSLEAILRDSDMTCVTLRTPQADGLVALEPD